MIDFILLQRCLSYVAVIAAERNFSVSSDAEDLSSESPLAEVAAHSNPVKLKESLLWWRNHITTTSTEDDEYQYKLDRLTD